MLCGRLMTTQPSSLAAVSKSVTCFVSPDAAITLSSGANATPERNAPMETSRRRTRVIGASLPPPAASGLAVRTDAPGGSDTRSSGAEARSAIQVQFSTVYGCGVGPRGSLVNPSCSQRRAALCPRLVTGRRDGNQPHR